MNKGQAQWMAANHVRRMVKDNRSLLTNSTSNLGLINPISEVTGSPVRKPGSNMKVKAYKAKVSGRRLPSIFDK